MQIDTDEIVGYYDEDNQLICLDCAQSLYEIEHFGSDQILTRGEVEDAEEVLYFCDVHLDKKSNQIT